MISITRKPGENSRGYKSQNRIGGEVIMDTQSGTLMVGTEVDDVTACMGHAPRLRTRK